jgi:hypothetical protein
MIRFILFALITAALTTSATAESDIVIQTQQSFVRQHRGYTGHAPWQVPVQGQQSYLALVLVPLLMPEHESIELEYARDLHLTSLTISIEGTADDTRNISNVRVFTGGAFSNSDPDYSALIAPAQSFTADNGMVTFDGLRVPILNAQNQPLSLHVACDIASNAPLGSTFRFFLDDLKSFVIEDADGNVVPVQTLPDSMRMDPDAVAIYPVDIPFLHIAGGTFNEGRSLNIRPGSMDVVLGEMRFIPHDIAWRLDMIGLGTNGALSEVRYLKNVRMYRDVNENGLLDDIDEMIGAPTSVVHYHNSMSTGPTADDGLAHFEDLDYVFAADIAETWLAVCDIDAAAPLGETFTLWPGLYRTEAADPGLEALSLSTLAPPNGPWPVLTVVAAERPTAVSESVPDRFQLRGASPNPFNPSTNIRFGLAEAGLTSVSIYAISGQRVRELHRGTMTAGWHEVVWDGRDESGISAASGVYLYRVTSDGKSLVGRMTLMR